MINMLFSLYNFHESWASDIVAKYINCNDKVLIIPFSFDHRISNDKDWQDSYSKENGKYYESVVAPFVNYGIKLTTLILKFTMKEQKYKINI